MRKSQRRKTRRQRGGLGQAYRIPGDAVVSASFQEPDYSVPVLMTYRDYREDSNPIFDETIEKLIERVPEKNIHLQNAKSSGRKEVQVQQTQSRVKSRSSRRRRRTANRQSS